MTECFNIFGYIIKVECARDDWLAHVRRDFASFRIVSTTDTPALTLHLIDAKPDYDHLPAVKASVITPRNISFEFNRVSYIDYFGRALAIFQRRDNLCTVHGVETDLMREVAFLFILSMSGQYLDAHGLHRIHGLGVSRDGKGALLLLPSGGGKSTMAMQLLNQPGFKILSEDTPVIDRHGTIHPFPMCIGVRPGQSLSSIPQQYVRCVQRMEFEPKSLIDTAYFSDRIGQAADPSLILVGQRNLGDVSEIIPLSRTDTFKTLINNMVVGLGVYQGLEFLLERGLWEAFGKLGVAASRTRNAIALMRRSRAFRFVLGRNRQKNTRTLLEFLDRQFASDSSVYVAPDQLRPQRSLKLYSCPCASTEARHTISAR